MMWTTIIEDWGSSIPHQISRNMDSGKIWKGCTVLSESRLDVDNDFGVQPFTANRWPFSPLAP